MQEGHVFLWLLQFIVVGLLQFIVEGVGSRIAPWPLQAQGTIGQGAEWYLAFSNFDNFSFCSIFLRNLEEKLIRMSHSCQRFSWMLKGHLGSGTQCMYHDQVNYVALATPALVFPGLDSLMESYSNMWRHQH